MKAGQRSAVTGMSTGIANLQIIPVIKGMTIRNGVYLFVPFRRMNINDFVLEKT